MKHIETESPMEKSARGKYRTVEEDCPAIAGDEVVEAVREYVSLTREIDRLKLEASKRAAVAMEAMGGHPVLVTKDGLSLAVWRSQKKNKVDYAGILAELDCPQEVVDRHTSVVLGSRAFSIAADWMEPIVERKVAETAEKQQ